MLATNPEFCISYRLKRAARLTAKYYDNALRPIGLKNTQFTLIAALTILDDTSIGGMSKALAVDGTTLTRNLDILVRRGLVENQSTEDGRVRTVHLTEEGKAKFKEAYEVWVEAQLHLMKKTGEDNLAQLITNLENLEEASS